MCRVLNPTEIYYQCSGSFDWHSYNTTEQQQNETNLNHRTMFCQRRKKCNLLRRFKENQRDFLSLIFSSSAY